MVNLQEILFTKLVGSRSYVALYSRYIDIYLLTFPAIFFSFLCLTYIWIAFSFFIKKLLRVKFHIIERFISRVRESQISRNK